MWHEARKQEKKIRGIMVNYKKRAERRRAFYERMKADPTTFLRLQGTNYKIHIDHQNTLSDDLINMMPWQGDRSIMIDRFDVRAHLDYIPPLSSDQSSVTLESDPEEQKLNYERYRTLVMIEASGVAEDTYLKQLDQEEQNAMFSKTRHEAMEKKEKSTAKASIGYTYQNSTVVIAEDESESSEDESESDLDIDVAVNVDELDTEQKNELNHVSIKFNIIPGKYCSMLKADKDEAELVQKVKEEEEARGQLRGRRAKRDRRSLKDQQRKFPSTSPLSYMRRESPSYEPYHGSRSRSSSSLSSAGEPSKVEYITEFGAAKETKDASSLPSGDTNSRKKSSSHSESARKHRSHKESKRSRSRSRSHDRGRSRSHDRGRSRSHDRERSRSHDRERSRSHDHERSRSSRYTKSNSEERHSHRSRERSSHDYNRTRSRSRSRSRRRHQSDSYNRSRSRSRENYPRYSRDSNARQKNPKDHEREKGKRSLEGISKVLGAMKNKTSLSTDKSKLTPQEKLKKRMQLALNKQLKIDKKEERKKKEFKEQEKQERDDDLREISRKWKDQSNYRHSRSRSRSLSPGGWTSKNSRQRSNSPDDRRQARSESRSPSPLESVPLSPVDMDSHMEGEDVVHYVYGT